MAEGGVDRVAIHPEIDGGDASDDSFVMVTDGCDDHDVGSLDQPDLVGGEVKIADPLKDGNAEDGVLIDGSVNVDPGYVGEAEIDLKDTDMELRDTKLDLKEGNGELSGGDACEEVPEKEDENAGVETRELPVENAGDDVEVAGVEEKEEDRVERPGSTVDDAEKLNSESVVEAKEVEKEDKVNAGNVDVGEKLNFETEVAEAEEQPVSKASEQEGRSVTVALGTETSFKELAENAELNTKVEDGGQLEEHESVPETEVREPELEEVAVDVDGGEGLDSETNVAEANQSESAGEVVEESLVSEAEANLQELAAAADALEKLDFEIKVAEADHLAKIELVRAEEAEAAVAEAKLQEEEKRKYEVVAESSQHQSAFEVEDTEVDPLEKQEYSPNVEEEQKAETVVSGTEKQLEPEPAVEVKENEIPVTEATKPVDPKSALQEEHLPSTEFAELDVGDVSQIAEAGEKHEGETLVARDYEIAETESATAEEDQCDIAKGSGDQEVTSKEHVAATPDSDIVVSDAKDHEVDATLQSEVSEDATLQSEVSEDATLQSELSEDATLQSKVSEDATLQSEVSEDATLQSDVSEVAEVGVREIGLDELKSAVKPEIEQQPEILVSEVAALEAEDDPENETVTAEPSDQPGLVLEVNPENIPETAEAIPIAEDSLEDGSNELPCEATISAFESSASPILSQIVDREISVESIVTRESDFSKDIEQEGDVCEIITDQEGDVCEIITDSEKEVAAENGNEAVDIECMDLDQSGHVDDGEKTTHQEVHGFDSIEAPTEEPSGTALDGERPAKHVITRHFNYIIRIPRSSDDDLRAKLQHSRLQLDEKTQVRDSIRVELQKKKASLSGFREKLDAAKVEERAARAAVAAKRKEMDSVQSMINKMKTASSIDEINDKIHHMDRTLQHESISLTQEKQYIREIKNLKQLREQISANMGTQAEVQEVFDRRDQIEDEFKTLRKELDSLRAIVMNAENDVRAARKVCDDEFQLLRNLQEQFKVADDHRQEAYTNMHNLRMESNDKIRYFNAYKDDQRIAINLINAGDQEAVRSHCSKQVEAVMELWNTNEEFRKQYVKSNEYSTLRRLRTLDGRSLGPDEEPPVLPTYDSRSSSKVSSLPNGSVQFPPLVSEKKEEIPIAGATPKPSAESNQSAKLKKPVVKVTPDKEMVEKAVEKEITPTRTKEEEELARKAEESARKAEEAVRKEDELRKAQAAAELKELHRMEQKAKAKEAEERKKKKAEKDKIKAEFRAKKEAELKEKRKAKKEKKAAPTDPTNGAGGENAPDVDTAAPLETAREPETIVTAAPRRSSRPASLLKQQNKLQPLPLPLRNKSKRKMQTWMWVLLSTVLVLVLFLAGNYASLSGFNLPNFGF